MKVRLSNMTEFLLGFITGVVGLVIFAFMWSDKNE